MRDSLGGYVSYQTTANKINTIFFSRKDPDRILIRYTFDSLPKTNPIFANDQDHQVTSIEKDLISIRQDALRMISRNEDKFFTFYENTSFNPIPVINGSEREVYILTAPRNNGAVLLGNDYLLFYDIKNTFISKKKLHNSLISLAYKNDDKNNPSVTTMHSHVLSDYIEATDICTLLLYKDFVEWKTHIVISRKYVSILDLEKESLLIMTRKAWEKIDISK